MQVFVDYCCELIRDDEEDKLRKALFHPKHIVRSLPFIVINEIFDADTVKLRLIGTEVELVFGGGRATGKNVIDFLSDDVKANAGQFFQKTAAESLVSLQEEDLILASGRVIMCNTLGFPMADANGVNRFRITISNYEYKRSLTDDQADLQIIRNEIRNMRFVACSDLVAHYFT